MDNGISRINEIMNRVMNNQFVITESIQQYWDKNKEALKSELLKKYSKAGLTSRHVNFMVDVFGTKYADTLNPESVKNIMKNPSRFVTKVVAALGGSQEYKDYVKAVNNAVGENIVPILNSMLALENKIDDMADDIKSLRDELFNRIKQEQNDKEVDEILNGLKKYEIPEMVEKFRAKIMETDLTGKRVVVLEDDRVVSKKILADIDYANNETLVSVISKLNQYIVAQSAEINEADEPELDQEFLRADQVRDKLKGYLVIDTQDLNRILERKDRVLPEGYRRMATKLPSDNVKDIMDTDPFRKGLYEKGFLNSPKAIKLLGKYKLLSKKSNAILGKYGFKSADDIVNVGEYKSKVTFTIDDENSKWVPMLKVLASKDSSIYIENNGAKGKIIFDKIAQNNGKVADNGVFRIYANGPNVSNIQKIIVHDGFKMQDDIKHMKDFNIQQKVNNLIITLR